MMITRGDVQRVIDAFILEETLYWWLHPIERVNTVRDIDAWDFILFYFILLFCHTQ